MPAEVDFQKACLGKTVNGRDIWMGKDLGRLDKPYKRRSLGMACCPAYVPSEDLFRSMS